MSPRVVAMGLLAVTSSARAATLCVDADGGGCFRTIQEAVNAAAPGDTVRVRAGVYFENVTIPAGKDGLRLQGVDADKAVVDPDAPHAGSGIRVESNDVEVDSLGIRNGQHHGVVVAAGVSGAHLHDLRMLGVRGPSAILAEQGSTGLRIAQNAIRASGRMAGIHLEGGNEGSIVSGNTVEQVDNGIVVSGPGVRVVGNFVAGATTNGIRAEGPDVLVADNTLARVFHTGIAAVGPNPTVRGNHLTNAGPVSVDCVSCTGGLVAHNANVGSSGSFFVNASGFLLRADATGLLARDNAVSRAGASGFEVFGPVHLARNHAVDLGTVFSAGFFVDGEGALLEQNLALRMGGSGFKSFGGHGTFDSNRAFDAYGGSAFLLDGGQGDADQNVFTGNRAAGSALAGFAIIRNAILTVLSGNTAANNRYDFCDDGVATDVSGGNQFQTVSSVCDVLR